MTEHAPGREDAAALPGAAPANTWRAVAPPRSRRGPRRCVRCRQPAVVELPGQRTAFCPPCYLHHVRQKVARTMAEGHMLRRGERAVVAVSGGKDSLCLWDVLATAAEADATDEAPPLLEAPPAGVYLDLGIGEYSARSRETVERFAEARGLPLHVVAVAEELGAGIPEAARSGARSACGVCGLSKRHLLNRFALAEGYDVVLTGHNLDDEAAVLLGNVLQWDLEQLRRQRPVLEGRPGLVRRAKPLVRTTEWETAAYCVVAGIDYVVEECPMAEGNRHLVYKDLLARLEDRAPGIRSAFHRGFLRRLQPLLEDQLGEQSLAGLQPCARCGAPTTGEVCAFCRVAERLAARREAGDGAEPLSAGAGPRPPAGPPPSRTG
ncbi:ATP-binding protein [Aciditerrimonas ferrireducens]|uniref:ATP-binding protein n=1 Tax=Aciditerrimonas ferrireducens TaxID=667306 RepID=A0ABV6C2Z8_9ACTN